MAGIVAMTGLYNSYMRRILIALLIAVVVVLQSSSFACEWPANWLGPADNTYRVLRIGVFYHAAVLHDLADAEGGPSLPGDANDWLEQLRGRPELSPDAIRTELARVRFQLNEASQFYWRNTRFNCILDYEWIVDNEPRLRSTIANSEAPWYRPVDHPYYGDARAQYDGLLQVMVLYVYDEELKGLKRVKGGGGWTWGAEPGAAACGWSWWAACTADNACGSDWLLTHEFGHQLDSLFNASGHPELWFNHLAPLEGNIARFGEHFDANSYILRRIPEADWHDLLWGEQRTYTDGDGDHVPDTDEWLSAHGFLTDPDPSAPDSDGDGLDDYAELMCANGNRYGHGERLYPAFKPCDPTDRDTDRDGVPDGLDPLPMLPVEEHIPAVTEDQPDAESSILLTGAADGLDLGVALSYYEDYHWEEEAQDGRLVIKLFWGTKDSPEVEYELKVMLDLDNDGWFAGSDNYRLLVDDTGITQVARHEASSPTEWPQENREAIPIEEMEASIIEPLLDYLHGLRIVLPRAQFPELAAKPGEEIGINAGIREAGLSWYYMLGEPNTLVPFELR